MFKNCPVFLHYFTVLTTVFGSILLLLLSSSPQSTTEAIVSAPDPTKNDALPEAIRLSDDTVNITREIVGSMPKPGEQAPKELISKLEALVGKIPNEQILALIEISTIQVTEKIGHATVLQMRNNAMRLVSPEGRRILGLAQFLSDNGHQNEAREVAGKLNSQDSEVFQRYGVAF